MNRLRSNYQYGSEVSCARNSFGHSMHLLPSCTAHDFVGAMQSMCKHSSLNFRFSFIR